MTLDELVAQALGNQALTILRLQAENETLKARVVELEPKPVAPPKAES